MDIPLMLMAFVVFASSSPARYESLRFWTRHLSYECLLCLKTRYRPGIINTIRAVGVGASWRLSVFATAESALSAIPTTKGVLSITTRVDKTVAIRKTNFILFVISHLRMVQKKRQCFIDSVCMIQRVLARVCRRTNNYFVVLSCASLSSFLLQRIFPPTNPSSCLLPFH